MDIEFEKQQISEFKTKAKRFEAQEELMSIENESMDSYLEEENTFTDFTGQ